MEKRLLKRLRKLSEKVILHKSLVVHQISEDEAEQRAYYRLLQNKRMSVEQLGRQLIQDCQRQVKPGAHYLIFQDTTQPNLERKREQIKDKSGLGVIGDNASLGFFLHPALVMEADTYRSIGYSYIKIWSRNGEKAKCKERAYKSEPIESKESYRWLDCVEKSRGVLSQAGLLTVVSDREGDIYEVLDRLPDEQTHVLVRSNASRKVLTPQGQSQVIKSYIQSQALCGTYSLKVVADARKKRQGREALMEVRIGPCNLLAPQRLGTGIAPSTQLYVIQAKESAKSCPEGEKPIEWILTTTHTVENLEDAMRVIHYYQGRWNAEQVFRLSKRKGLDIEQSDLESGQAILKMALLAIFAAAKIITLHQASKKKEPIPVEKTITLEQKRCLAQVGKRVEGRTKKQKNPYPADTLQWVYWIIARLGGWKPHEKQAGVVVLFRGWQRFSQIFEGWSLAQDVS